MTYARNLILSTAAALLSMAAVAAAQPTAPAGFSVKTLAHAPRSAVLGPDDLTVLGGHVFVAWQNGVGTKGEPSTTGTTAGTVVEYTAAGRALRHWNLKGKIDGLGADPATRTVIATVNEDGNSSIYTIRPAKFGLSVVRHYRYSPAPDAGSTGGVSTGGGTDAVAVAGGVIYVTASAPKAANGTAAFRVRLDPHTGIAHLSPTFADNASAVDGVTGAKVKLALTDPDSNAFVPFTSSRFKGDFVLAAQADQQLVFAHARGIGRPSLTRLPLTHGGTAAGVDDVRWAARSGGTLYLVDSGANTVYAVSGPFAAGEAFASLDTVGTTARTTEVDTINLHTGALSPFITGLNKAKGLAFSS